MARPADLVARPADLVARPGGLVPSATSVEPVVRPGGPAPSATPTAGPRQDGRRGAISGRGRSAGQTRRYAFRRS
ncbi:hypothetical protein [Micromonospora rosaria]|uniref:hypothetical protein n=1 Tax=Micromonospora rosaria TaxID=47874 RepID=UPI001B8029B2|nr:hypothetical protein [Micromonospora rosaria]